MITIPLQLRKPEFRFVLLKGKIPFEVEWQKKGYKYDDKTLLEWLEKDGNYGVLCGQGSLIVIDFDNENLQQEVLGKLPQTFTVRSGGGLLHLYFECDNTASFKLFDKEKNTLADVQGSGKQIVGSGSTHPNGNKYVVFKDVPIAKVDYAELKAVFAPQLKDKLKPKNLPSLNDSVLQSIKSRITVPNLLQDLGIDTAKNPTECPFHKSKHGKCLSYTAELWNCFHCDEGGDIFNLYMEYHKCDFPTAKKYFQEKIGVIDQHPSTKDVGTENNSFPTIDLIEAMKNRVPTEWISKGIIPAKGLMLLAGAPKSYKSIVAFHFALCCATQRDFLGKFKIENKKRVLIIQEENSEDMLDKITLLVKGLELSIDNEELKKIHVSLCQNVTIDTYGKNKGMAISRLVTKIEELNPEVVICDSTVRMMEGDENSASEVRVIERVLKEVSKDKKILWVLLHHTTKEMKSQARNTPRGSGDFIAMADVVWMLFSKPQYHGKVFASIPWNRVAPNDFNNFAFKVFSVDSEGKKTIDVDKMVAMKVEYCTEDEKASDVERCSSEIVEWLTDDSITLFDQAKSQNTFVGDDLYSADVYKRAVQNLVDSKILSLKAGWKRGQKKTYDVALNNLNKYAEINVDEEDLG